jgi:hypothetical protein
VPYSSRDDRRRVQRESQRRRRAGLTGLTALPESELDAADVLGIVGRELQRVARCHQLTSADRARAVAALASTWVRVHEHAETAEHVAALRAVSGR